MASLNKVLIIGHLGKDPESRFLPSGAAVCNFSVATTEGWKDKKTGEKQEKTEWHNIVAHGRTAEVCGEYLKKGSKVYIEGRLQTRKWQDKQTGADRYTTEIVADQMQMLGGKQESRQESAPAQQRQAPAQSARPANSFDEFESDLPF